jgi:predicted acyl esterase
MQWCRIFCRIVLGLVTAGVGESVLAQQAPPAAYPEYPSETPQQFTPVTDSYDYTRRDVMIPMRDGVKLHTVILVPKGATHAGIMLTRTPYSAKSLTTHTPSGHARPPHHGPGAIQLVSAV